MQSKIQSFHRLWHDEEWMQKNFNLNDVFDFSEIDSLALFNETHPAVMTDRVRNFNWNLKLDLSKKNFSFKDSLLYRFEKLTGNRLFEYKNYSLLKG